MNFKTGDKVKVTTKNSAHWGKTGEVLSANSDGTYFIQIAWGAGGVFETQGILTGFFESELQAFDPEHEALIELAETLDKARLQANAIEAAASQLGVYGVVVEALTDTLELIVGEQNSEAVYESIMADGNTVREALAEVVK